MANHRCVLPRHRVHTNPPSQLATLDAVPVDRTVVDQLAATPHVVIHWNPVASAADTAAREEIKHK